MLAPTCRSFRTRDVSCRGWRAVRQAIDRLWPINQRSENAERSDNLDFVKRTVIRL